MEPFPERPDLHVNMHAPNEDAAIPQEGPRPLPHVFRQMPSAATAAPVAAGLPRFAVVTASILALAAVLAVVLAIAAFVRGMVAGGVVLLVLTVVLGCASLALVAGRRRGSLPFGGS